MKQDNLERKTTTPEGMDRKTFLEKMLAKLALPTLFLFLGDRDEMRQEPTEYSPQDQKLDYRKDELIMYPQEFQLNMGDLFEFRIFSKRNVDFCNLELYFPSKVFEYISVEGIPKEANITISKMKDHVSITFPQLYKLNSSPPKFSFRAKDSTLNTIRVFATENLHEESTLSDRYINNALSDGYISLTVD